MWDDGLNGRFCAECFDHVVDAEELLVKRGIETSQARGPRERSLIELWKGNIRKRSLWNAVSAVRNSYGREDKTADSV
jgi:hypothetical protein